ncbi:MAG: transposase [Nanoarchaeota archaeon]
MKEKKKTVYYRFVKQVLKALKIAHVRRYPHKHDPKKYGVWVHVVLFALKQLEDKSYRFIVDMVSEMPGILALFGVAQVPHWTTLHKAVQRLQGNLAAKLVSSFVQSTRSLRIRSGIDSTGLQPSRASAYYTTVLKKDKKKRRKIRKHIKLSTVVDLDHQLPVCFKIRRWPASDQWDGLPLVRKAQKIKPMKSLDVDKGYTGEPLRKFVVEKCGAEDRIKVKNKEVPIWRTKGEYLKKAKRKNLRANYRSLCETFHSVLKKITGSTVRAIKVHMQNKEVAFKVFACSALRRTKTCLFTEVFY